MKSLVQYVVTGLLIAIAGCGQNLSKEIIGTWRTPSTASGSYTSVTFMDDGTMSYGDHDNPVLMSGRYTWTDKNHIRFVSPGKEDMVLSVEIKDGALSLAGKDARPGVDTVFRRAE